MVTTARTREREQVTLDWAQIQNSLGDALAPLGERETERPEKAVAAYRAALAGFEMVALCFIDGAGRGVADAKGLIAERSKH